MYSTESSWDTWYEDFADTFGQFPWSHHTQPLRVWVKRYCGKVDDAGINSYNRDKKSRNPNPYPLVSIETVYDITRLNGSASSVRYSNNSAQVMYKRNYMERDQPDNITKLDIKNAPFSSSFVVLCQSAEWDCSCRHVSISQAHLRATLARIFSIAMRFRELHSKRGSRDCAPIHAIQISRFRRQNIPFKDRTKWVFR
jgi:hypothetical protein